MHFKVLALHLKGTKHLRNPKSLMGAMGNLFDKFWAEKDKVKPFYRID
jgi:hypothetical protein